jgi:hypothetical protein
MSASAKQSGFTEGESRFGGPEITHLFETEDSLIREVS